MSTSPFTQKVIKAIRAIPFGQVSTYGNIAAMAGNRLAARQVVRVLHSSSRKEDLPWHRVINKQGKISLARLQGYEQQKELLEAEGVVFDQSDRVDLDRFLWVPCVHFPHLYKGCKEPSVHLSTRNDEQ